MRTLPLLFDIVLRTAQFSEKKAPNLNCVFRFSLQLLFEIFLTLRRIQPAVVINVKTFSCKVPDIFVGF